MIEPNFPELTPNPMLFKMVDWMPPHQSVPLPCRVFPWLVRANYNRVFPHNSRALHLGLPLDPRERGGAIWGVASGGGEFGDREPAPTHAWGRPARGLRAGALEEEEEGAGCRRRSTIREIHMNTLTTTNNPPRDDGSSGMGFDFSFGCLLQRCLAHLRSFLSQDLRILIGERKMISCRFGKYFQAETL